ncbi:hypothetical protein K5_022 [Pseudomonas phage K5]|nr:hypothetical protein BH773_gp022 [Pseudomonas phage K5]AMD42841.1 hypothetical protein K5_022 [Pseudomonas phage K5]
MWQNFHIISSCCVEWAQIISIWALCQYSISSTGSVSTG